MSETLVEETVAPEVTPDANTEIPDNNPENTGIPEVQPEQPEGPSELDVYQDILAKADAEPDYQMTEGELEVFDAVQEKIVNGQMEVPESKKLEEKPKVEEAVAEESKDGDLNLSTENASVLQDTMTQVGAKDVSELAGKVKGLIDNMKSSGGKLGTELKDLQTKADNHQLWLNDLAAGKPEAIAYLDQIRGKASSTPAANTGKEEYDVSDFVDEELGKMFLDLQKTVKEQANTISTLSNGETQRVETNQRQEAVTGWVDDIVELVTADTAGAFGLTPVEARALAKDYLGPDGHTKAVHPKFQKMHELIQYAHKKGLNTLQDAHVLNQHENGSYAQQIVNATKNGQKSTQHIESPNSAISNNQSKVKSNVPDPHITDEAVKKMEGGDFENIPDSWTDENGTFVKANIPERFHKKCFG